MNIDLNALVVDKTTFSTVAVIESDDISCARVYGDKVTSLFFLPSNTSIVHHSWT